LSWYLDTSAAIKLLVVEAETDALSAVLTAEEPDLVACYLLETELRRAVARYDDLTQQDAVDLLDGVSLFEVSPSLFRQAGLLPGKHLRSLDALHLAAAVRIGVERIVTYDERMISAAHEIGVTVLSPVADNL
jgi:predicted nucleic acid-binding protein